MKIDLNDVIAYFNYMNFNKSMLQILYYDILQPLTFVLLGKNVRSLSFKGFYVPVT